MTLYRKTYTFDEIFNIIKNKINESNDKKLTFWGNSGLGTSIIKAISFFVSEMQLQVNILSLANKISTAWGRHLDRLFLDSNFKRKDNTYAVTIQTFFGSNDRIGNVLIPDGTVVKTDKDFYGNTINYSLLGDIILPLSESSITGTIRCSEFGSIGNVLSGTIKNLDSTVDGISGTINYEDISNGAVLEKDNEARDRFGYYLLSLKNANDFSILNAVYGVEGITYAEILENYPANGTFTIFCTTESGIVDSILKARILNAVKKIKAFTVIPNVISPIVNNITLSLDLRLNTNNFNSILLQELIKQRLKDYVNLKSKYILYKSDIIQELRKIDGVIDVEEVYINGDDQSLILTKNDTIKITSLSEISITLL